MAGRRFSLGRMAYVLGLDSPLRVRVLVLAVAVLVGYLGVYLPLGGQVDALTAGLAAEQKRSELARTVSGLRTEVASFRSRLQAKPDALEWGAYVRGGIDRYPLRLTNFEPKAVRDVGPYKAVVLYLHLEGRFVDLCAYLHWLETNDRLMRVDSLEMRPHQSTPGVLVMKLTVLGVMG